ncbi:hypothetical protein GWK18_04595 [Kocuria sp. JC486]|uniref:hypothetical protein n=1 Tax=Kocuria sp. JC486 TaxID=1970736 RepID=UPI001422FCDB|nr:hypothetical protein [Kocuria sp. JC486]NHU84879.1 hypothetical protein [Kocuria sp. JC486]
MRNKVTITPESLVVETIGLDKLWAVKKSLTVPWAHVRGAAHTPEVKDQAKGWRGPGLRWRDKLTGTFHADDARQFWNVSGYQDAITIDLVDEPYSQVIISIDDPVGTAERINTAAHGAGVSEA